MLPMYAIATFTTWDDKLYIQSHGICIVLCIAPTISDLFLAILHEQLEIPQVTKIFRYADDFLVVFNADEDGS